MKAEEVPILIKLIRGNLKIKKKISYAKYFYEFWSHVETKAAVLFL